VSLLGIGRIKRQQCLVSGNGQLGCPTARGASQELIRRGTSGLAARNACVLGHRGPIPLLDAISMSRGRRRARSVNQPI
jgi:hypothetical protein